jgi:IS1 family transposase
MGYREVGMFEVKEIQADELCTFVGKTTNTTWLFTIVEVSSRLWPTKVLGRRSYRNTELLLNETVHRGKVVGITLVTSDGFELYNFVRPHLALKFGNVCKTPAMQAGLAKRPLSFRDIFGRSASPRPLAPIVLFLVRRGVAQSAAAEAPLAA